MASNRISRREVLLSSGMLAAGIGTLGEEQGRGTVSATTSSFTETKSTTSKSLFDVVSTARGPHAVGNSGNILRRTPNGWVSVIDSGVTTQGKGINTAAVSSDGKHLWMAGGSGVLGRYNVINGTLTDFSHPQNVTSSWESIAVAGPANQERIVVSDSSGNVLEGRPIACGISWGGLTRPTNGNTVTGINFHNNSEGQLVDSTGSVYETDDPSSSWTKIGISNFSNTLNDVDTNSDSDIVAPGSSGSVARYDGSSWSIEKAGSNTLYSIDRNNGEAYVAGSSGSLYKKGSSGWTSLDPSTGASLHGVNIGSSSGYPDSIVGTSGTILEKGSYSATNDTISLKNTSSQTIDYAVSVDGLLKSDGNTETTDGINSPSDGTYSASGQLDASKSDSYQFSGHLNEVRIPESAHDKIEITVNGRQVSLGTVAGATWSPISDKPTTKTLQSVTQTARGLHAVGGGGKVIKRDNGGDWKLLVKNGPGSNGNALYCSESTKSGYALWFAGSSGSFGRYDVTNGEVVDYTAPENITSTFSSMLVYGYAGSEMVYLGTGSGQILVGEYDSGNISWTGPVTPGDGSAIRGIDNRPGVLSETYICDSNGKVFKQLDSPSNWMEVGIQNPGSTLYDINVAYSGNVLVSGGSGRFFRQEDETWTARKFGGNSRYAVDSFSDRRAVVGASGQIYERRTRGWDKTEDYKSTVLKDVVLLEDSSLPAVAVGGSGTILEKSYTSV